MPVDYLTDRLSGSVPSCVLFDLDGTLIDSVPDLCDAMNYTLQKLGLGTLTEEQIPPLLGHGLPEFVSGALQIVGGKEEQLEEAISIYRPHYAEHNAVRTSVYEGVLPVLEAWRKRDIPMAVVTNKPWEPSETILERLDLKGFFRVVVGGNSLPTRKPEPEMVLHALQACGAEPSGTWMVGDGDTDMEAARAAGAGAVGVSWGYRGRELLVRSGADVLLEEPLELLQLLN